MLLFLFVCRVKGSKWTTLHTLVVGCCVGVLILDFRGGGGEGEGGSEGQSSLLP
jgi:hypothetical protein